MALTEMHKEEVPSSPLPAGIIYFLGFGHIIFALLTGYLMFALWPVEALESANTTWKTTGSIFGVPYDIAGEKRILLLVFLSGATGSFIHSSTSFANFVGTRKLDASWTWWYILRPFIGVSIAFVFYLVFRGGLLNGNTEIEDLNVFGILTISALTGLFSDRATLKLKEIFDQVFKPKDDRSGKLEEEKHEENPEAKPPKNNGQDEEEEIP